MKKKHLFFLSAIFLIGSLFLFTEFYKEKKISSSDVKKKIVFIVNPISGAGKKTNIKSIIKKNLDRDKFWFDVVYTKYPAHATEIAKKAVLDRIDIVVAIGGDGTINEVGKGLINTDVAMGIVPKGSGNGLARHLMIPMNLEKAIAVINNLKQKQIDTVKVNEDIFLSVAGIGLDAQIAKKFAKSKKRGFFSYLNLVLKKYPKYKPRPFEMIIDDNKVIKEGLLVSFANASQYGNDIKISPTAQLDDGFLEVSILKNFPIYKLPDILLKLKNGNIDSSKYYETVKCKNVVVRQKHLPAHLDGEFICYENDMHISVLPSSLRVITP